MNERLPGTGYTYVVEDDHVIRYAGDSMEAAKASMLGRTRYITVWRYGKYIGDLSNECVWIFKTKHHPEAEGTQCTAKQSKNNS